MGEENQWRINDDESLVWIDGRLLRYIHAQQIELFGGLAGTRDEGLVESALHRARNKWDYGERSLTVLAAAYGYGLTTNHGFVDGNKRVGFVAMAVFLELNGYEIEAEETDVVVVMRAVASGELHERELADWLQPHLRLLEQQDSARDEGPAAATAP